MRQLSILWNDRHRRWRIGSLIAVFCLLAIGSVPSRLNGQMLPEPNDDSWLGKAHPQRIYKSVKSAAGYGPDRDLAEKLYAEAEQLAKLDGKKEELTPARRKELLAAGKKFKQAADRWPDSAIEEDALYMAAECYYFADYYPEATKQYDRLIKKYPNSRHFDVIDARRFVLARYWLQTHERKPNWPIVPNVTADDRPLFDTYGHGLKLLERIRLDDPGGKLGDDATMAAANAHFKSGKYWRADQLYEDIRVSFPESKHQFAAHLLGLKCKLLIYQGPQYDGQPLLDAEKLLKQITRQFPQEAQAEAEYLKKAHQDVRMELAKREWDSARYFDRRREYAAARQYYENVRRNYPDTSLSRDAEERLAAIADRPDKPKQQAEWLVNLFPRHSNAKPLLSESPAKLLRR